MSVHGTVNLGAAGVTGTAAQFFGVAGSYIAVAHGASLAVPTGSVHLSFNAAPLPVNTFQTLLFKGATGTAVGDVEIGLYGNRLYAFVDNGTASALLLFPTQVLTVDTWYTVELRFGVGGAALLIDGVLEAAGANAYTGGLQTNTDALALGAKVVGASVTRTFSGVLDEVRLTVPTLEATDTLDFSGFDSGAGTG